MRNYPVKLLSKPDTEDQTGAAVFVGQVVAASFIAILGDEDAEGTLKVQGSNAIPVGAPDQFIPDDSTFADITNATSTITAGVGPAIVIPQMTFQYVRVVYTSTMAGATTIDVIASFLGV